MRLRAGTPGLAAALVLAMAGLLAAAAVEARPAQRYIAEPTSVSVSLSQPIDGPVQVGSPITIARNRASRQERIYYSVEGDLRSPEGHAIPAEAIEIQNEYGHAPASYNVLVLNGGDPAATFTVRLRPGDVPWWRPGTYRGRLVSAVYDTPVIDVVVEVGPFVRVFLLQDEFEVHAGSGPGQYLSERSVTVLLVSNTRNWELWRSFTEPRSEEDPERTIPLSRMAISEGGGPFEPVPAGTHLWLTGSSLHNPYVVVRSLRLRVETTWSDWAGEYKGGMRLTLSQSS